MFSLDFSIKRISSIVLLFLMLFWWIIPYTQAKDNPLYQFPNSNGVPSLSSHSGITYTKKDGSVVDISIGSSYFERYHSYYMSRWADDVFYPTEWKGYIYIDTSKLPKDKPSSIIDFPVGKAFADCPQDVLNCWMNAILYMPEEKTIVSALGYVNPEWRWVHRINVIYNNIDENTPNFMFFLDLRRHVFPDSLNKWQAATSMRILREDNPWSGKLSTKEANVFTAGSTPIKESSAMNLYVEGSPALTVLQYKFQYNWKNWGLFNINNLCYVLWPSSRTSQEYKDCLNEAHDFVYKVYSKAWTDDFWFKWSKEPIWTITDNNNVYDSSAPSPILDEEAPEPPTCQFSEWVVSCAVEWVGYYFSKLIYGFKFIFSKFFQLTFEPLVSIGKEIVWFFHKAFQLFTDGWKYIYNLFISVQGIVQTQIGKVFNGSFYSDIICQDRFNYNISNNQLSEQVVFWDFFNFIVVEPTKLFFSLIAFVNPFTPQDGTEICTYDWMKQVSFQKNWPIDVILIMFLSIWILLLFYRN